MELLKTVRTCKPQRKYLKFRSPYSIYRWSGTAEYGPPGILPSIKTFPKFFKRNLFRTLENNQRLAQSGNSKKKDV